MMVNGTNVREKSSDTRRILRCTGLAALLLACGWNGRLAAQTAPEDSVSTNSQLVGQMAPAWTTQGWVNADTLDVKKLRGKVVLLRFLNDSASSASTLNEFYRTYGPRGMAVVGIYAPAPFPTPTSLDHVRELAEAQGFEFAIGLDARWETLHRYWLDRADAELTSATFLIDRKGIIRYIQPDGQYDKNSPNRAARREYSKLEKEIETLLNSDEATGGPTAEPKSRRSTAKPRSGESL
jgi:peroxiredoxin